MPILIVGNYAFRLILFPSLLCKGMWEEDDVQSLDFLQQSGMFDRDATASTAATMPTLSSLMTHIIL